MFKIFDRVLLATLLGGQLVFAGESSLGSSRLRAYIMNFEGEEISVCERSKGDCTDQDRAKATWRGYRSRWFRGVRDQGEGDGRLSFIDPKENKVTEAIKVGSHPQQLATSQDGSTLYVPLNGDHAVAIAFV